MAEAEAAAAGAPQGEPEEAEEAVDWIVDRVLAQLAEGHAVGPTALRLLVRRFALTGRDDLGQALGPALADAVATLTADMVAPSLVLFVEAQSVSDDELLREAVRDRVALIQARWPSHGSLADAMMALTASLAAAAGDRSTGLALAVDELERIIGLVYEPGDGVTHRIGVGSDRGDLVDHTATASALVRAHAVTGRLPYAMLAEELMQYAWRTWWDEDRATFSQHAVAISSSSDCIDDRGLDPPTPFSASCAAVSVLSHLAALAADADYRSAVVSADGADYGTWARRIVQRLGSTYRTVGAGAVEYGLAIDDWQRWQAASVKEVAKGA